MMIAYGTSDRPLPPVQVATFSDVASVTPIAVQRLGRSPRHRRRPRRGPAQGRGAAGALHAVDPARQPAAHDAVVLRSAPVGERADRAPRRDRRPVHRRPRAGSARARDPAGGGRARVGIAGTARGLDTAPSAGVPAMGLADCERGLGTGVCVQDAIYLPWSVAPDRDVVLAVDRPAGGIPPAARVIDPRASASALIAHAGAGGRPRAAGGRGAAGAPRRGPRWRRRAGAGGRVRDPAGRGRRGERAGVQRRRRRRPAALRGADAARAGDRAARSPRASTRRPGA